MSRDELIDRIRKVFSLADYQLSDLCEARPISFDFAARNNDLFLLVKVLSNIEGLNEATASDMRQLAALFKAVPLVIGEKAKNKPIEDDTVYIRYGVPCVSPMTLSDYIIEGVPPLVYAAPGGLYVEIDGDLVRKQRLEHGISLGELAKLLGVSRRSISKYEEGMNASVDVALRLEEVLDVPLAVPLHLPRFLNDNMLPDKAVPSSGSTPLEREILTLLTKIGFSVYPTQRAPFDTLSRDKDDLVLSGVSEYSPVVRRRAMFMSSFSRLVGAYSMFVIYGNAYTDHIDDTLLLRPDEIKKIKDKEGLLSKFH